MTEEETRHCASCECAIEDDSDQLCPFCGAELSGNGNPSTDRDAALEPEAAPAPPIPEQAPAPTPAITAVDMQDRGFTAAPSDCADLHIEYDFGRIFVEGLQVPFQFRLTPKREGLDNLFVEIRRDSKLIGRDEPDEYLVAGRNIDIHMAYRAPGGLSGKVPFEVYVGYQIGETEQVFKARAVHTVYRAREKVGAIIENLKIELNNAVHQGHAGDAKISQQLSGLEALRPQADDPATELQPLDLPARWQPLSLIRCRYKPVERSKTMFMPPPPREARLNRLTIRASRAAYHLLADPVLQIGYNRACEIVARSLESHDRDVSVSRFHCRIENRDGICRAVDLGYYPTDGADKPSTHGTYVDGLRIPSGGQFILPKDRAFALSLSGSDSERHAYVFDAYQHTGAMLKKAPGLHSGICRDNESSCLVLHSRHAPSIVHVALWKIISLRDLGLLEDQEAWFSRSQNAFLLMHNDRTEWLAPGRTYRVGGITLEAIPYESWGPRQPVTTNRRRQHA